MIEVSIIAPTFQRKITVQWIRVFTPTGNFVIQSGHAPLITMLAPLKNVELGFSDGSIEELAVHAGMLKTTRTTATIIIDA